MAQANKSSFIIGVDVGGTKTQAILFEITPRTYKIIAKQQCYTQVEDGKKQVLNNIKALIKPLLRRKKVSRIGIALPGIIENNRISYLPNVDCLNGVTLASMLKSEYNLPISLHNDGDCSTYAEYMYGAGKKGEVVAQVTVGTGVGGGLIVNGNVVGNAMEIGHSVIQKGGSARSAGMTGTLEGYVNGNSVTKRYYKLKREVKRPKEIFALKSLAAQTVLKETAQYFAIGVGNVINTVSPQILILGGGLCKNKTFVQHTIKELEHNTCVTKRKHKTKLVATKLGDAGGCLGAALLSNKT